MCLNINEQTVGAVLLDHLEEVPRYFSKRDRDFDNCCTGWSWTLLPEDSV